MVQQDSNCYAQRRAAIETRSEQEENEYLLHSIILCLSPSLSVHVCARLATDWLLSGMLYCRDCCCSMVLLLRGAGTTDSCGERWLRSEGCKRSSSVRLTRKRRNSRSISCGSASSSLPSRPPSWHLRGRIQPSVGSANRSFRHRGSRHP